MEDVGKVLDVIKLSGVLSGLVVLVLTWVLARLVARTANELGTRFTDRRLLIQQVGTFVRFGLYLLGVIIAFSLAVTLSREAWLGLAGTIAVTVGFAVKDLASSIIAGLTILIDFPDKTTGRATH